MSSTIEEITSILGAQRIGTTSSTIDWILTDSRSLCFPEETLFFALKTNAMTDINISRIFTRKGYVISLSTKYRKRPHHIQMLIS